MEDVESCATPETAVSVDWRGPPCRSQRHGGTRAAVFVLGFRRCLHKRKQVCPSNSSSVNARACEPARLAGGEEL
ncbi:uncharacterized protein [Miscanthus floridulus]|uniref:uncharacterized protein isoform X2 n=1 Tax=Miscanthus floridulus TaxID=154761 RepID=UPI0034596D7D